MPDTAGFSSVIPTKYCIFGCGTNGYNIIEELAKENERAVIVDRDESRVRHLRDQKYDAYVRDITASDMLVGLPAFEIAFVMAGDADANLAAVLTIKKRYPEVQLIARAVDPVTGQKLTAAGADLVIYPQEIVARTAVFQVKKQHASRVSQRLFSLLAGWDGILGIITHKNPDPDAIASAMALAEIARHANSKTLTTRIFYEGNIGHQENRTFVNLLDIKMERLTPEALQKCTYLAMVDCPGPGFEQRCPTPDKDPHHRRPPQGWQPPCRPGHVHRHPARHRGDREHHDPVPPGARHPGRQTGCDRAPLRDPHGHQRVQAERNAAGPRERGVSAPAHGRGPARQDHVTVHVAGDAGRNR